VADRWSNPSAGEGVNRFRVWPLATDSYDSDEFAANWDKLDAILGYPLEGTWPPTLGVGGGIYREIEIAKDAAVPLGVVFPWYRPHSSIALPSGAVPCDGSAITAANHSFPGGGTITVPDLRNAFVLGADASKAAGAAAAAAGTPAADTAAGAPGPQATGGSNAVAMTKDSLPLHKHTGSLTGWSPRLLDYFNQGGWNGATYAEQTANNYQVLDNRDEAIAQCGPPGCYWSPDNFGPVITAVGNFEYQGAGGSNASAGAGGWDDGQDRHSLGALSSEGSGAAHENRPQYVGLIWLVKVKVSD